MMSLNKKDRFLTGAIIIIAMAGIAYFGYQAVSDVLTKTDDNPFEYNIDYFKKSDSLLHTYKQVAQLELNFDRPYAIAMGADNNLIASGDDMIHVIDQNARVLASIKCGTAVRALAVDVTGDIYAGKEDHVEIYSQDGHQSAGWDSPGENTLITSIAVGDRFIFVADAGNHIVWKYDKKGALLARIGEKDDTRDIPGFIIPSPYFDVAIDPEGFLWVVNPGRHSLENYTLNGDLRSLWGEYGMTIEGFCGCCNPTHLAILGDGSFVTSEKGIARVKVYNRIGELVSVVAAPELFIEGVTGLDLAVDDNGLIYVLDPAQKAVRVFKRIDNDSDIE
jgi:hypothetical protein